MKNLTEYCNSYLRTKLNSNVVIEEINTTYNKEIEYLTLEQKWNRVNEMIKEGISKSKACQETHLNINTFNKLLNLSYEEIQTYFMSTLETRQFKRLENKKEIVYKARELYKKNYSLSKIGRV